MAIPAICNSFQAEPQPEKLFASIGVILQSFLHFYYVQAYYYNFILTVTL